MQLRVAVGAAGEDGRRELSIHSRPEGADGRQWATARPGRLSPRPRPPPSRPRAWPPPGAEPLDSTASTTASPRPASITARPSRPCGPPGGTARRSSPRSRFRRAQRRGGALRDPSRPARFRLPRGPRRRARAARARLRCRPSPGRASASPARGTGSLRVRMHTDKDGGARRVRRRRARRSSRSVRSSSARSTRASCGPPPQLSALALRHHWSAVGGEAAPGSLAILGEADPASRPSATPTWRPARGDRGRRTAADAGLRRSPPDAGEPAAGAARATARAALDWSRPGSPPSPWPTPVSSSSPRGAVAAGERASRPISPPRRGWGLLPLGPVRAPRPLRPDRRRRREASPRPWPARWRRSGGAAARAARGHDAGAAAWSAPTAARTSARAARPRVDGPDHRRHQRPRRPIARHLVREHGARHLLLASRRGERPRAPTSSAPSCRARRRGDGRRLRRQPTATSSRPCSTRSPPSTRSAPLSTPPACSTTACSSRSTASSSSG